MIYIVVALKPEAQAFVDYFRLKKSKLSNSTLFTNEKIRLIISHIGVESARIATQTLINNYDITDEDSFYNIGICGASNEFEIGDLLDIGTVNYQEQSYTFNEDKATIHCVDEEITQEGKALVDMESFGFYDAVIHNPAIKKFHIYKVVSDHFEPHLVTKEKTKSLLFAKMEQFKKMMHL